MTGRTSFDFAIVSLLQDFRDDARAHCQTAFANGELRTLLQRHRGGQCHFHIHPRPRPTPRPSTPTLSPASPASRSLWNISTPVHTVVITSSRNPMISSGSPTF